ncbi:MAG: response regulator [Nitrospirota bacterium]
MENKRVFVVEPDEVTRAALQFMLHDENETHELRDVPTVYLKGREHRPDLILLGLSIIRDQGVQVLGALKGAFPGVKIVLVVDADAMPTVKEALGAGADDTLLKPLRVEAVRETVDRHLGRNGIPHGVESNPFRILQ